MTTSWAESIKSFDRVADIYDATRAMPPAATAEVARGLAALLAPLAARPRVLEVGIGTGRIAVPLASEGVEVVGVDVSPAMLRMLRAKGAGIEVALAESSRLPFRHAAFDAALFIHVLHLVPDPEAALRAALAVVRPGGLLLASGGGDADQDQDHPRHRLGRVIRDAIGPQVGWSAGTENRHQAGMSAFKRVLADAGGAIEATTLSRWLEPVTPRGLIYEVAARTHSLTWAIPEQDMEMVVERLRREFREGYGDLDITLETEEELRVLVGRRPAG